MTDTIKKCLPTVLALQDHMLNVATGCGGDPEDYKHHRAELMDNPRIRQRLPEFVRTCRDQFHFWEFIKHKFRTYAERREFLWDAFAPLLNELEARSSTPSDEATSGVLRQLNEAHVHEVWQKALERRSSDPAGAITAARTLLETVCKLILDDLRVTYTDKTDLPKLYGLTAEALKLAPSQHTEPAFKSILGSCQKVVNDLATLRNRVSDAHGRGRKPVKPQPRHAELAVNLAGTMAAFLVSTWRERSPASSSVADNADPLRSLLVDPITP